LSDSCAFPFANLLAASRSTRYEALASAKRMVSAPDPKKRASISGRRTDIRLPEEL
jgi:hypothetical protein